jgi:hypothetical protein
MSSKSIGLVEKGAGMPIMLTPPTFSLVLLVSFPELQLLQITPILPLLNPYFYDTGPRKPLTYAAI